MKHSNTDLLEKLYANFARGDFPAMLAVCDDKMTFQISGKSKLAGKYDPTTVIAGLFLKQQELSGKSMQLEVHDILGSDRHATALASVKLSREGKTLEYRTVHVWRIENGKPVAWYEYPRDLYQYDAIWS